MTSMVGVEIREMAENLFFLSLDGFFLLVTSDDLGVDDVDEPVLEEDDGKSPWDFEDLPPKNFEIRLANDTIC